MATGGGFRQFSMLLLGTTFLVSAPVSAALHAAEPGKKPKSIAKSVVPSDLKARLADALRQGERELIARAYDSTYRNPGLRNAVVDYAADLSPAASRHVITAADLGVLTSGQRMMLAPNAAQVLATATTTASGLGATSYQNVAMTNNNNSPNLPNPLPSLAAQTWNLTMIGAQAAYTRGFTGAGVTVTVADTGFDTTNAGLVNKLLINLGKNYVVENGGTYDPNDLSPESAKKLDIHGSHVSGIIAGEKFGNVDAHGVAYDANIIPIRAITEEGYSTVSDSTADALNYFASLSGTMIYNASYGPNYDETLGLKQWPVSGVSAEANAALNALKAGKIIVAAAGNDRLKSPDAADNPSGLALLPFLNPAHAGLGVYDDGGEGYDYTSLQRQNGQIIAVMAVGSTKAAASYSNLCGVTASWCVAAPGGDGNTEIYSTIPYDTYGFAAGTSMATPTVSGAIAVLIQANPTYNAQDLAHLLFSTTEDLGDAGIDAVFGHGLIRLDRATEGPTTLAANAAVSVAADQTVYWSQLLNTQGEFSKIGTGILTISGRTNAAGNVYAQLGTLAVDGTLTMTTGGMLNVAQPATLAGFGTVVGNSTIAGTLSPGKMANIGDFFANNIVPAGTVLNGNSVGELTFNGNVTLTSTATTRIDIDGTLLVPGGPGTCDKIYVTGAGNVFYAAGTLTPVLRGSVGTVSNYTPALGTDFAIVQAQDGARTAGSFSSLVQPVAGLPANGRFDLVYDPTALTLVVTPASFSSLATGANGRSVAAVLDSQRPAAGVLPSGRGKTLYDALYRLESEAQYDQAVTQLSGPGQPAIASASLQAFTGFLGAIGDRQNTLAVGGEQGQNGAAQSFALSYAGRNAMSAETGAAMDALASIAPADRVRDGWSVWGQGFGRNANVRDSGDLAGSKAVSAGFTIGADRWFSNNLMAGGAFGYARTTASSTDIQGKSDTYAGAAYASWMPGAAVVDVRIAAGPSQMSTGRQIMLSPGGLQGNANGIGLGTSVEAGYRFALAHGLTLKPFAGVSWQGFRRDGYSESQAPFGLAYAAQTYDKLTTITGAALSTQLRAVDGTTLAPEFKLGWGYDLRDTTLVSQAALLDQPFLVSAAAPGRNAALVGAKISGWRSDAFRMFASYNGEFRSNATSHQVSAGARYSW
ncbi:autotransporter domain-containing protein [Rhodopseudomonas palustris]|uniref:autotransporter domain-containing protein n=1 Tax=Rhodopseudomonas palustris TaxID=1076 RepID=UPI0005A17933|nr:autotransporter domain-containing protein [Rhodopseudomonas palustris]